MPHFFITSNLVEGNTITITDKENYKHIAKSLRAKVGEKLLLIDEKKIQYETVITEINNSQIISYITKKYPSNRSLDFTINLAQSPLRNNGQEIIIEKSTELGVTNIYPIKTDYCTLSSNIIEKKIPKWQRIMYESSKQCERADIPTCKQPTNIEELVERNEFDKIIVFCERITTKTIKDSLDKFPIKKGDNILVILGPEGGFSNREFDYFKSKNLEMLTLGNLILRAETATIIGLGNIIYEYSNFNR